MNRRRLAVLLLLPMLAACSVPATLSGVGARSHLEFDIGKGWRVAHAEPYKDVRRLQSIEYRPDPGQPGLQHGRLEVVSSPYQEGDLGGLAAKVERLQVRICPGSTPEVRELARDATSVLLEIRRTPCAVPYRNDRLLPPERVLTRHLEGPRDAIEIRYSLPEAELTPELRAAWIARLEAARLTPE